jgi:Tol biopolymer transport system component
MKNYGLAIAALLLAILIGNTLAQASPEGAISVRRLHPPLQQHERIYSYALSPDQQTVVYTQISAQQNTSDLYAVPRRGTSAPVMLNRPGDPIYTPYRITPDSQSVIYNTGNGLSKVSLSGGDVQTITLPLSPTYSLYDFWLTPDGQSVVYLISEYIGVSQKLLLIDADGGAPTELASSPGMILVAHVTDEWVVYKAAAALQGPLDRNMFSASLNGGQPLTLTAALPAAYSAETAYLSPNQESVVIRVKDTADQSSYPPYVLYDAALDGSSLVRLSAAEHTRPGSPLQSPDGQRIVYTNELTSTYGSHLYSVSRGGGPASRLDGPTVQRIGALKITADSQSVVFEGSVPDGQLARHQLFRAPIAGGPAQPITGPYDGYSSEIFLAQNDQTVVYAPFVSNSLVHIYTVPISGGLPSKLSAFLGNSSRLYPLQPVGDGNTLVALQDGQMFDTAYAFDLRTGTIRELTPPPFQLSFSVKGWTLTDSGDVIWQAKELSSPSTHELFVTLRDDANQTHRLFLPQLQR